MRSRQSWGSSQGNPPVPRPHVRSSARGQVVASHPTQLLSGTFEVELYVRPGEKPMNVVKFADAEIERLKKEGPTPLEVKKAQNRARKRPRSWASSR